MFVFPEVITQSPIYLNSTWVGNADQSKKSVLAQQSCHIKMLLPSFLFLIGQIATQRQEKKSTRPLNINMTLANICIPSEQMTQTSKLSHSIGGCLAEHTQSLKISSFRSLQPCPLRKLTLTTSKHQEPLVLFLAKRNVQKMPNVDLKELSFIPSILGCSKAKAELQSFFKALVWG